MEPLVILSKLEQEYLLRVIEGAPQVRDTRQLFLWAQGQMQALLPHELLVCLQFGPHGALTRLEALHATVLSPPALERLCDRQHGLAVRLARSWLAGPPVPCMTDLGYTAADGPLAAFQAELEREGYDNLMVHGTGELGGVATVFLLLRLPLRPGVRHAYFFELLLPHLHLALLRLGAGPAAADADLERPISAREAEILHWVREGKSNYEIGCILGISGLTVKNHLQRIYRVLGVSNRTQAVARSQTLRLPARAPVH